MAEPIKNRKLDPNMTAPTPQNTPANNAPISSHAQQPGVASIKEEDLDKAATASVLAQNPKLVSMIQGRLGSLIGKSSGYVESLPPKVRERVAGLKAIQQDHSKLEAKFQERVLELEKEFFALYTPLYKRRAQIINGQTEPTKAEIEAGTPDDKDEDEDEEDDESKAKSPPAESKIPADVAGIPEFWLTAMKNQVSLAELLTDRDEKCLQTLTDIRMQYLDRPGFQLIFVFAENDFFTNKELKKTYYYQEDSGYGGDFIYDHADGDKINWKPDQDLTVRIESKKQRNKTTKQTRVLKKTVPTNSFFNFFNPPNPPKGEDESVSSDIEERLELDYQLGEDIKEKLIPRAIDWFTGEALQFEELDEEFDEDDMDDEDEDDDDDEASDDKDDDDDSDEEEDGSKPKQEAAECKQS